MPLLISLGFRKTHGKDVVADHLVQKHGFKKLGWADLLKAGVNKWHGWDDRHGYGELKEVVDPYWGYSPREAYQKIGTNLMRNQWSETFWVDCAMRQIKEWMDHGYSVTVNDSRFFNEVEAVLRAGGELWRIDRPSMPAPKPRPKNFLVAILLKFWERIRVGGDPGFEYDHPSETSLLDYDGWSHVLVNDGSIKDLQDKVDAALQELL